MKKKITYALVLAMAFAVTTGEVLDPSGKAGFSGSPGESTCLNCHVSFALNAAGGSITLSSDIPAAGYTPGQTYTMNVTVERAGFNLYGLSTEILNASNASSGTITITNATETQLKTLPSGRKCVTHRTNGGASTGSKTFSFSWTAPATGAGTLTFYAVGNACNGNGTTAGDYVYSTNITLTEATNSIDPAFSTGNIRISPNPAKDWLKIEATIANVKNIRVTDMSGKIISDNAYEVDTNLYVGNLAQGLYFVQAINKEGNIIATQKWVKE